MIDKNNVIRLRLNDKIKKEFQKLCIDNNISMSKVLLDYINEYILDNKQENEFTDVTYNELHRIKEPIKPDGTLKKSEGCECGLYSNCKKE